MFDGQSGGQSGPSGTVDLEAWRRVVTQLAAHGIKPAMFENYLDGITEDSTVCIQGTKNGDFSLTRSRAGQNAAAGSSPRGNY